MTHRIGELFAGIGGVTGGLLDAGGFEPAVLIDSDPVAAEVFRTNFPQLKHQYHVRKVSHRITGKKLLSLARGALDGLLGCPPCQGLSAAGSRDPGDSRNDLLFEMRRLIAAVEPNFFIIENVPSLLRSTLYADFEESLASKYSICAETINAAEYGLPQLRRRAVIIGFHKKLKVEPTLPQPTHGGAGKVFDYSSGKYVSPATALGREALDLRPLVPRKGPRFEPPDLPLVCLVDALSDLPASVPKCSERDLTFATAEALEYRSAPQSDFQRVIRGDSMHALNHRRWHHGAELVKRLTKISPGDCPAEDGSRSRNDRYFSQAYGRLHKNGLARTVTTNFHNPGGGRFTHYASPRTLTLREALRLQGFPDTFAFDKIYPTDAKRLVGNAFPRLLAAVIGRHVARLLR